MKLYYIETIAGIGECHYRFRSMVTGAFGLLRLKEEDAEKDGEDHQRIIETLFNNAVGFTYTTKVHCPRCEGLGYSWTSPDTLPGNMIKVDCKYCGGSGFMDIKQQYLPTIDTEEELDVKSTT